MERCRRCLVGFVVVIVVVVVVVGGCGGGKESPSGGGRDCGMYAAQGSLLQVAKNGSRAGVVM